MNDTMTYKGYSARITYDVEDKIFTGCIANISDGVVEDYVETCAKVGKKPLKAFG